MSIRYEINGPVVVITIDRPEAMNALDPDMDGSLRAAWQSFAADDNLRAAVLTGAGDAAFCAGADLRSLIPSYRRAALEGRPAPWSFGGLTRHVDLYKPVIAAINGHALAGGLELALACDIRLCSPNATFGLAEVRWAIIPGAGGTQRLPRAVPLGLAMEMILTGDPIDADTALRCGLVNRILNQDELLPAACALAERIASRGPIAVRRAKQAVLGGLLNGLGRGLVEEEQLFVDVMRTQDAAEGYSAFSERRVPTYRGL